MTVPLTPVAHVLPATIVIPADGEDVDSSSVALYVQPIIDAQKYAEPVIDCLTTGSHQVIAGSSFIESQSGSDLRINNVTFPEPASATPVSVAGAGGLRVIGGPFLSVGLATFSAGAISFGRVRAPRITSVGSNLTGAHTFDMNTTDHVYNKLVAAGGCVWQILTTVGLTVGECIRFVNFDTNFIAVKDPSGTTLVSIAFFTNNIYAITVQYTGGTSFVIIDQSVLA